MLHDDTRRTVRVLLLIRRLQVRVLPGALEPQVRAYKPVLACCARLLSWQSDTRLLGAGAIRDAVLRGLRVLALREWGTGFGEGQEDQQVAVVNLTWRSIVFSCRRATHTAERMERDFAPPSSANSPAIQPAAPTGLATPSRGVDLAATLLLGLAGGLVGGCAAMAGWTAMAHRRMRRAASAA